MRRAIDAAQSANMNAHDKARKFCPRQRAGSDQRAIQRLPDRIAAEAIKEMDRLSMEICEQ
jgi:hypothetical protein